MLFRSFSVAALFVLRLPATQWQLAGFRAVPFLAQLFAAASYQLSWSIYVSDYSRYLPRDVGVRESFWWTYLGAFVGGAWMMLVGSVALTGQYWLDTRKPDKADVAAHIVNLVWNGLTGLEGEPQLTEAAATYIADAQARRGR